MKPAKRSRLILYLHSLMKSDSGPLVRGDARYETLGVVENMSDDNTSRVIIGVMDSLAIEVCSLQRSDNRGISNPSDDMRSVNLSLH